jgi:hypothetical protein
MALCPHNPIHNLLPSDTTTKPNLAPSPNITHIQTEHNNLALIHITLLPNLQHNLPKSNTMYTQHFTNHITFPQPSIYTQHTSTPPNLSLLTTSSVYTISNNTYTHSTQPRPPEHKQNEALTTHTFCNQRVKVLSNKQILLKPKEPYKRCKCQEHWTLESKFNDTFKKSLNAQSGLSPTG